MATRLLPGMKVRYLPQPDWGIGHLLRLDDAGLKAAVEFPLREPPEPVFVSTRGGALVPVALAPGQPVRTARGQAGTVTREEEGGRGLRRYVVALAGGGETELPETELKALASPPDLLTSLKEFRTADAKAFLLRKAALKLDDERRSDALGALLASRVMVKPHQVGVVQRVLEGRAPRFILADEVGLGKTIEAGMIFSALRLNGLCRRVLVVAPGHLTVQWLVELFHKFNHLFTLLDQERYQASLEEEPTVSPWARFELVITSLELLQRNEQFRTEAAAEAARWDLVIIDEAHHLKGPKAHQAAQGLAANTWGLLLLTATPMQLDPAEYQSLLALIDPLAAPTVDQFQERLARQEALATAVRALLAGDTSQVASLAARFPQDDVLASPPPAPALLSHLAETYSLSSTLVRNRRAVVGGFSRRTLHVHPVQLSEGELSARREAFERLAQDVKLRGAPLATLLRRLDSSPLAFAAAAAGHPSLAQVKLPAQDGKFQAFRELLLRLWQAEPGAKVLVFTEARETLEGLQKQLSHLGVEALGYHGDLPLVERDRQVARFRDPDGPRVLVCTEVGGEGRNFQFAHHLVHYDLPFSPATVEQRIGRLDRIGQAHAVDIHVFEVAGTFSADVLAVLRDAVGVFGETVGGLDAVLEDVEPTLTRLALAPAEERAAYVAELKRGVEAARAQVQRAYDPLLDVRSFDREDVEALVTRAEVRGSLEPTDDETLDDRLRAVARDLDERLEECVTELAERIGVRVDVDQEVDAFECAFHFGHALNIEALPGFDITEERTLLGTFWRDTAVEKEEIHYFATGHPLVEALFGFLRDGPYGRTGARHLTARGARPTRGLELLFHLVPPSPADLSPGALVPARQLSRFIQSSFLAVAVAKGPDGRAQVFHHDALEGAGHPLKGPDLQRAFPELPSFVEAALPVAEEEARRLLEELKDEARAAIEKEKAALLRRARLSLKHQGLPGPAIEALLEADQRWYAALLESLAATGLKLDAACAFVLEL